MTSLKNPTELEVGYDVPAIVGMNEADIQTPCLIVDLDALEKNIRTMGQYAKEMGVRHRVHGKMHKSVDIALLQEKLGDSCGVCCQKVSEAEVFARGGIKDVLVSNQVRDPAKIDRLARMPKLGARTICCVDDIENVAELSAAVQKHDTQIECLVEIDCGAGRCGVQAGQPVVDIAKAIAAAPGLKFAGIQAYQGAMQHLQSYTERREKIEVAVEMVARSIEMLKGEGLECDIVGVSPDSPQKHCNFIAKYGLGVRLLADPDRAVMTPYGAWRLKKNYGREYMGVARSTFLVAPDGTVARAWPNVRSKGHAAKVLVELEAQHG